MLHSYMAGKSYKSRDALAEKIIDLVKDNAYPFGGYIRDQIAGVDFTDLDLFFPSCNNAYVKMSEYSFFCIMKTAGFTVTKKGTKQIYNKNTGWKLSKTTFEVADIMRRVSISVDLVRSENGLIEGDHPFTALDADVNSLWYNKVSDKIEVSPWANGVKTKYTVDQVVDHIARRVFEIPADAEVSAERLDKLFKKGYKPKNCHFNVAHDFIDDIIQKVYQETSVKEEKKMDLNIGSTQRGFVDTFKSDMEKAAYRSCGTQMTSTVKQGILLGMKNAGAEDGVLSYMSKMLDTDGGTAFVSAMLGNGLQYAPVIGSDPRVTRLSEEFRVAGYAQGMNLLFAALMQYVMPGIMAALQTLPPVTENDMAELDAISKAKVRVGQGEVPDLSVASENEQMAEVESLRKQSDRV